MDSISTNNDEAFVQQIVEPSIPGESKSSIKEQQELFDKNENKVFHWVKIVLILIFGLFVVILSAVVLFHLLAPCNWRWLSETEVASLEKMFVTGIGAALLGKFGNKLANFN
jgi:hypothetical protein